MRPKRFPYLQHLDKVENVTRKTAIKESNLVIRVLFSPKLYVLYNANNIHNI